MRGTLWHKRIPTLFAFVVLFLSIWVTSYLIQSGIIFVGRATPDKTPQNIIISNITENTFTVAFTTNVETVAGVSVEGAGAPFVVYDNRNRQAGTQKPYFSHYITVSDLSPKTNYQFSIISDGETFLSNGQKYTVQTGDKISGSPPKQDPVVGKVILPEGGPASDTIVELQVTGGQIITDLTNDNGGYIIPTNSIRNSSLAAYLTIGPDEELTLTAFRSDLQTQVKVLFKNASVIPPITLSQKYDFTKVSEGQVSTASSQLKTSQAQTGFGEVRILTPGPSQSFIDNRPLFRGTALPNKTVKITIESNPITAAVLAGSAGAWSFRPDVALAPGEHKITIISPDRFGIMKTVSQTFSVFASGSQVAQSATPSATPTITVAPTLTPTPALSITPVASISPTVTATIAPVIPSPTPTTVLALSPTAAPTNPPVATPAPTGSSSSIALTIFSIALILGGTALLFLL